MRILFFVLLLVSSIASAQPAQERIVIENDDYQYSLLVPERWNFDMENAAEIMWDVANFPDTISLESAVESSEPIIQVTAFEKQDENTIEDLNFDLEQYKKEYAGVKFAFLDIKHTSYKTYSKLASVEGVFYQYLTYINAGNKFANAISIAMNTAEHPATEAQIKAFEAVVNSLKMKDLP